MKPISSPYHQTAFKWQLNVSVAERMCACVHVCVHVCVLCACAVCMYVQCACMCCVHVCAVCMCMCALL